MSHARRKNRPRTRGGQTAAAKARKAAARAECDLKRFWISWYVWPRGDSRKLEELRDPKKKPAWPWWISGQAYFGLEDDDPCAYTIVAMLDAKDEAEAWSKVSRFFKIATDIENKPKDVPPEDWDVKGRRFCKEVPLDYGEKGDRFPLGSYAAKAKVPGGLA